MDVTALLNSSTGMGMEDGEARALAELPSTPSVGGSTPSSSVVATPSPERTPPTRTCETRTSSRSRTPWDAGGYSLPLSLEAKVVQTPSTARPMFHGESPLDTMDPVSPRSCSPRHKFSDSHSSMASYGTTFSANSGSHSRFSSLSTVSEYLPPTAVARDFDITKSYYSHSDRSGSTSEKGESGYQSPTPVRPHYDHQPLAFRSNDSVPNSRPANPYYGQDSRSSSASLLPPVASENETSSATILPSLELSSNLSRTSSSSILPVVLAEDQTRPSATTIQSSPDLSRSAASSISLHRSASENESNPSASLNSSLDPTRANAPSTTPYRAPSPSDILLSRATLR